MLPGTNLIMYSAWVASLAVGALSPLPSPHYPLHSPLSSLLLISCLPSGALLSVSFLCGASLPHHYVRGIVCVFKKIDIKFEEVKSTRSLFPAFYLFTLSSLVSFLCILSHPLPCHLLFLFHFLVYSVSAFCL